MKMLAAALSGATVAGLFVVMHADSPWFAPKPSEIFSVAGGKVQLSSGGSLIVGTVPKDVSLVLTDADVCEVLAAGDVDVVERDPTGAEVVKIPGAVATWGTGTTVPIPHPIHSNGHGVVFHPGTSVVLKNNGASSSSSVIGYLLVGYYAGK